MIDKAYDTLLGRKIAGMQEKALKLAPRIVDYYLEMHKELGDDGVEKFELVIDAADKDLYDAALACEDAGPEFCKNFVGIRTFRRSATEILVFFAKRDDA